MDKIIVTSGYFNPVHIGHLKLFEDAKKLGNKLIVIVNNDHQVKLKGSKTFMNENERLEIIRAIKYVDYAVLSIDKDKTVRKTLASLRPNIFAKGGDSTFFNVPEDKICKKLNINLIFGVGGNKIQSSSNLKK